MKRSFDLPAWIEKQKHNINIVRQGRWNGGGYKYVFRCPWNPEHNTPSAFIVQNANGAIAAGCLHKSCEGKNWQSLRHLLGDKASPHNGNQPEPQRETNELIAPEFSEDSLAQRFSDKHSAELRYTDAFGKWHRWTGARWRRDDTLAVFDDIRRNCRAISVECEQDAIARKLTSAQTVAAVERLARSDRRHAARADQWDSDPDLLNTTGGTVDLRTGELRPHKPEDYCSKSAAVGPSNKRPTLWLDFLARITADHAELQTYLQRAMGYALTGVAIENVLFMFHGTGANGKSVFVSTIMGILGDYARPVPTSMLIASKQQQHPTDLAGLCGVRLAAAVETPEGRHWDEAKIKAVTGGEVVTARYMHRDFFDYIPQFKLLVEGNHRPGLRSVDEAIRRRLQLVPFIVTIPKEQRDLYLAERLRPEWPGILQWAINGCLAWRSEGLKPPPIVSGATNEYLDAEDVVGRWIDDHGILGGNYFTSISALFQSWTQWAEQNGEYVGSINQLSAKLAARPELRWYRKPQARGFVGIALRAELQGY